MFFRKCSTKPSRLSFNFNSSVPLCYQFRMKRPTFFSGQVGLPLPCQVRLLCRGTSDHRKAVVGVGEVVHGCAALFMVRPN